MLPRTTSFRQLSNGTFSGALVLSSALSPYLSVSFWTSLTFYMRWLCILFSLKYLGQYKVSNCPCTGMWVAAGPCGWWTKPLEQKFSHSFPSNFSERLACGEPNESCMCTCTDLCVAIYHAYMQAGNGYMFILSLVTLWNINPDKIARPIVGTVMEYFFFQI